MQADWVIRRTVMGQCLTSQKRRVRAVMADHTRDLVVVGGDNDPIDKPACEGLQNTARDHGRAVQKSPVLSRQTLRATAIRNQPKASPTLTHKHLRQGLSCCFVRCGVQRPRGASLAQKISGCTSDVIARSPAYGGSSLWFIRPWLVGGGQSRDGGGFH